MDTSKKLLIIVPDSLRDLANKGELIDRYYNPGDLFTDILLVSTSSDTTNISNIQKLAGNAKLEILSYPLPPFKKTLLWSKPLLHFWLKRFIDIVDGFKPQVVRCYGAHLNSLLGAQVKYCLKIPLVISLHTAFEEIKFDKSLFKIILDLRLRHIQKRGLRAANLILPVYKSIEPFLKQHDLVKFEVAYNMINPSHIQIKKSYEHGNFLNIISVGRQIERKNPANILRAISKLPNFKLTLVGDGEEHQNLLRLANELDIADRVCFKKTLLNDELCRVLPTFDIFAMHTDYAEFSKTILEALLSGLPTIVNEECRTRVPELRDDIVYFAKNSEEGYRKALVDLASNDLKREALGRRAHEIANENWSPKKSEQRFVKVYSALLSTI